ncbi:MAG: transglutaminase [Flavobacteriaceae bacterium]
MKKLSFLFFFFSIVISAQNYSTVDNTVNSYPRYRTVEELANRIESDFSTDIDKVRAAFKWITNNIRYNLAEAMQPNKTVIQFKYSSEKERLEKIQEIKDNIVKEAFFSKLGVCEEYAQSLKKVCDLLDIEAIVLTGYVRNSAYEINRVPNTTNHAWNAVKVNNRWMLIDATWSSGSVLNGRWQKNFNDYFFDVDFKKIGYTHYTDDRKWNILLNQPSLSDFYSQPIYGKYFLKSNLGVIAPKGGVLYPNEDNTISLKIKNVSPSSNIYYGFKGDEYSKKPTITFKDNIATITISNPNRNTEVYLFMDGELALEYLIRAR